MVDVSDKNHLVDLTFQEFIERTIEATKSSKPHSKNYSIVEDTERYLEKLEKAFTTLSRLSKKKKLASSGVEWFLDNYFVIQEAIELIRDDLPEEYFNKLPSLEDDLRAPRIYHLARLMMGYYEVELVQNDLNEFLNAYQEAIPLQMSELWALPLMLRLVLVETISSTIYDLIEDEDAKQHVDPIDTASISSDEVIARALRTLLLFDRIDWKEIFETHSKVEEILREDPAEIYANMDFDTRDKYRKKIENLSKNSDQSEIQVAQSSVRLAGETGEDHPKRRHIGYFLIDEGETELKSAIDYQEDAKEKIRTFFFENNTIFYLGGILSFTLLVVFLLLVFVSQFYVTSWWQTLLIALISLVPASSVAVNLINSILTAVLSPKTLPKMDFRESIPKQYRTVVTIPSLLTHIKEIDFLLDQIELHYLFFFF